MIPTTNQHIVGVMVVATFVLIAAALLFALVAAAVGQQRRYLRARAHLGGQLLKAHDEERAAIARELHDDTLQRLIASAARLRLSNIEVASAAADEIDDIIHQIRGLARGIHPSVVDHAGIETALAELSASYGQLEGLRIDYRAAGDFSALRIDQRLALYRVAQEALGNVVHHARVGTAAMQLANNGRQICLVIEDRGVGGGHGSIHGTPGIGIASMRERMGLLGGTLEIRSRPGSGTTITAVLPTVATPQ